MAEGKKRLRMRGVKQASKRLEDDILGRSQDIADDPGILRPMCAGNCRRCVFDKVFKDIDKVARSRDSEADLLKLASKGFDDMARAYAGTISLAAAGKVPLLATTVIAGERVPYAVRGAVNADKLIGCQHYDDPKLRLLYYNHLIKKHRLHLYSFGESIVCSDDPGMPEDYLYDTWWETPYKFPDDGLYCGHEGSVSLNIRIGSLGETIHICEDCAKDASTLMFLVSRLSAADPLDDFEVVVEHSYHSAEESGSVRVGDKDLREYMLGRITDRLLIEKTKRERLGMLAKSETLTLIIGERNYGSDLKAFMADVDGTEREKAAMTAFLEASPKAVVVRSGKMSEVIGALWDEAWSGIIAAFTSPEFAGRYRERPRSAFQIVLEDAYRQYISADVVNSLPTFTRPGPKTVLADMFAKAVKVGGLPRLMDEISKARLSDASSRALAASFVYATEASADPGIKLSAGDRDFAQFLTPFAKKLVGADGETYRAEMNTYLMALSCGESV